MTPIKRLFWWSLEIPIRNIDCRAQPQLAIRNPGRLSAAPCSLSVRMILKRSRAILNKTVAVVGFGWFWMEQLYLVRWQLFYRKSGRFTQSPRKQVLCQHALGRRHYGELRNQHGAISTLSARLLRTSLRRRKSTLLWNIRLMMV